MTDIQTNKQNMATAIKKVLDDYLALWETIPAFFAQHGLLGNSLITIKTLAILQSTDITGYAAEKKTLKETMADKCMVVAGPLAAYARINDDNPLLNKVDIVRSDIIRAKDEDSTDVAEVILEKANDLDSTGLTEVGLVPADLTQLNEAIVAFEASIPNPRTALSETEAATLSLEEEFDTLDDEILTTLDELMESFKQSQKNFYKIYKIARKLVDTGIRHISIRGSLSDAGSGAVITKATVTAMAADGSVDVVVSSKKGLYRFFSLEPGNYTLTFEHEGYETLAIEEIAIATEGIKQKDAQMQRLPS